MNKAQIVASLIAYLEEELLVLKQAARATYEAATHEESKPENEYDTRGLEASYLAGAQAKRVQEIDEVLSMFKHAEFKNFAPTDAVSSTALVEVVSDGKKSLLFVMPKGGGVSVPIEGKTIQVITPHSALGEALLGLKRGDSTEVEIGDRVRDYQVLSVH